MGIWGKQNLSYCKRKISQRLSHETERIQVYGNEQHASKCPEELADVIAGPFLNVLEKS